jgi:hypothetical protein
MSTNLDDFFGVIKKNKNEATFKLFDFVEKTIMQLAEVVDQLDIKLTSMETNFNRVRSDLEEVKKRPAAAAPSASLGGGVSVPPPPGGGGGLPPLPGMGGGLSPPPARSSGGSGPPGAPSGGAPPADRPMNPMMVQANLQNELKAAFKNIRARLESGDE